MSTLKDFDLPAVKEGYRLFLRSTGELEAMLRAYAGVVAPRLASAPPGPFVMLDLGCGDGRFTAALLGRLQRPVGLELLLVDPSQERAAAQEALAPLVGPGQVRALDRLPAPLPPLDLVIANHSCYYDPGFARSAAALIQALRPGGLFVLSMEHFTGSIARFWGAAFMQLDREVPYNHWTRVERALRAAARDAGATFELGGSLIDNAFVYDDTDANHRKLCDFALDVHLEALGAERAVTLLRSFGRARDARRHFPKPDGLMLVSKPAR